MLKTWREDRQGLSRNSTAEDPQTKPSSSPKKTEELRRDDPDQHFAEPPILDKRLAVTFARAKPLSVRRVLPPDPRAPGKPKGGATP
jgi:hypothetical protein